MAGFLVLFALYSVLLFVIDFGGLLYFDLLLLA